MKLELEHHDIASIASMVADRLQPLLGSRQDRHTPDPIMDVKELAAYLKVKESWVYKQVEYKTIPYFHAGRYPRFRQKEIDAWIKTQSVPETASPYPALKVAKS